MKGPHNSRKTHCKYGHPLFGPNLRLGRQTTGTIKRICVACSRQACRDHYHDKLVPRKQEERAYQ